MLFFSFASNVMNFHTDHMDEITANWNSAENKNEAQRFGNITTSIYFLILFFPIQFVSFNLLARVRVFPRWVYMLPNAQRNLVSCFADWCTFLLCDAYMMLKV